MDVAASSSHSILLALVEHLSAGAFSENYRCLHIKRFVLNRLAYFQPSLHYLDPRFASRLVWG